MASKYIVLWKSRACNLYVREFDNYEEAFEHYEGKCEKHPHVWLTEVLVEKTVK